MKKLLPKIRRTVTPLYLLLLLFQQAQATLPLDRIVQGIIKADILTINPAVANYLIYPVPAVEFGTKVGLYTQNTGYN